MGLSCSPGPYDNDANDPVAGSERPKGSEFIREVTGKAFENSGCMMLCNMKGNQIFNYIVKAGKTDSNLLC